jgi:MoaA/NifB/PqqE/SkfB family radical SAM enzyme
MYRALKYGTNYIWNNQLLKLSTKTGKCLVKPCQVYILWTGICNFSCPMCKILEWKEKLPFDLVKGCLDEMSSWGVPKLTITGGEPLLFRDEFLSILEYASRKGILTHFSTNGTNLDQQFLKEYSRIGGGQLTVSLDGATKKTHDLSRNYDGAFEIAMKAIEAYKSMRPKNVILKIQPVLTNDNLDEIVGILEIARECSALFSVQAYDTMNFDILRKEVPLSEVRKRYPRHELREEEAFRLALQFAQRTDAS